MEITITDKVFLKELQELQADVESRQAVISTCINNNLNIQTESFKKYQAQLNECTIAYNNKKTELENIFLIPVVGNSSFNWDLNYATGIVTIN